MTAETREVIHWLRHPPLPTMARGIYELLFHAAYGTLPGPMREMIGMKSVSPRLVRGVTRSFLKLLRLGIGPEDPLQDAAIRRLRRSGFPEATKPA